MNIVLMRTGMFVYGLVALVAFAWWAPHFFALNLAVIPSFDYRYLAATGLPFGLFLFSVLARQGISDHLDLWLLLQVSVVGLLAYCCKVSFNYPLQANFFCPIHVWASFALMLLNFYQYRRTLKLRKEKEKKG